MQRQDLAALLAAGGLPIHHLEPQADETPPGQVPKYNGMLDPAGAEILGRALAEALTEYHPTSILIWEDLPDLILAHVVARELSATVVRAFDADGLVGFTGTFPPEARVVLLADGFRDGRVTQALAALVRQQQQTLVATAELFNIPGAATVDVTDVPAVALTRAAAPADTSATTGQAGRPDGSQTTEARK